MFAVAQFVWIRGCTGLEIALPGLIKERSYIVAETRMQHRAEMAGAWIDLDFRMPNTRSGRLR